MTTKIYLDNDEVFFVRLSPEQIADRINIARERGQVAVVLPVGSKDNGFMIDRIVRWQAQ